jgi:transposase-like protein
MFQGSIGISKNQDPDPEVVPKAKRRQFSAAYKKRILEEYAACTEPGEKGALLRREGIYSSYIVNWKRQLKRDKLAGSKSKKRGPKEDPQKDELEKAKREIEHLRERLRKAELIIEAQKKISQILGPEEDENEEKERTRKRTS